jgi:hypothetical protein
MRPVRPLRLGNCASRKSLQKRLQLLFACEPAAGHGKIIPETTARWQYPTPPQAG